MGVAASSDCVAFTFPLLTAPCLLFAGSALHKERREGRGGERLVCFDLCQIESLVILVPLSSLQVDFLPLTVSL